jgi:hypothetical protein
MSRPLLLVGWTAIGVALLAGAQSVGHALHDARARRPPSEERPFVPSPSAARFLSLGFNEFAADLWWARTTLYYGEGMGKGFTMQDVESMISLVNAFDPWFRRPYEWGSYAVTYRGGTPTQEEFRSSVAILERGLERFPNDWQMLWILGQRYDLDLKSDDPDEARRFKEMGAELIGRAARQPNASPDLATRAATLHTELGQRERALTELSELILTTDAGPARDKLLARYRELADRDRAKLLDNARKEFNARWKAELPYAPPTLYVLVGDPPRQPRLAEVLSGQLLSDVSDADAGDASHAGDTRDE